MRTQIWIQRFFFFVLTLFANHHSYAQEYVLVIHGGAGNITRENVSPEEEKQYQEALTTAIEIGEVILKNNGSSLDAVQAVICYMEDNPLFNAGKGSVLNENGKAEMDAAIMDGKSLKAGSVASVHTIKNPILAARMVMDSSKPMTHFLILVIPELQTIVMESVAYPCGTKPERRKRLVILQPDLFIFQRVHCAQLTRNIPCKRIYLSALLYVFYDNG